MRVPANECGIVLCGGGAVKMKNLAQKLAGAAARQGRLKITHPNRPIEFTIVLP